MLLRTYSINQSINQSIIPLSLLPFVGRLNGYQLSGWVILTNGADGCGVMLAYTGGLATEASRRVTIIVSYC